MSESSATWRTVRFGQIADNIAERVEPADADTDIYVGLEHLDPDSLRLRRWGTPADVEGTKLRFYPGDVIFGRRRAYQRKLAVAEVEGICSAHAMVLRARPDVCLPEFLPFFLQSDRVFERAMAISVGSLSPTINWRTLAVQEFPLPPLDEQRRIAEILWAAEDEREAFETLLMSLSQFAEVLSRRLFAESTDPRITFGQLVLDGVLEFQTGPFGTVLKAASYVSEGTPIINPVNMKDGRFVTESGPFLSREECDRLAKYRLKTDDIVLGRKGDVGRGVYVTDEYAGFILGSDCIRLRLSGERMLPEYVFGFLTSSLAKNWIVHHAAGTTMPGINEPLLARMEVPVPTLEVQTEAVSTLGALARAREGTQRKIATSLLLKKAMTDRLL